MTRPDNIPAPAVRRLSLYLRHLEGILAGSRTTVSSRDLSHAIGVTDAQVRKDLACFGQFGQPGIGYRVEKLVHRLREILGADQVRKVVVIGAGNLGRALMSYRGFRDKNFELVAVFDDDPTKIGQPAPGLVHDRVLTMKDLPAIVRKHDVRLAIIAVPASAAQEVADRLSEVGIRGILNFAPIIPQTRATTTVTTVDLAVQLEQLSFQVNMTESSGGPGVGESASDRYIS